MPDQFLNELNDRNDIVSVVSTYVPLKQRGRTQIGLCPFHGEKTPSFTVYPDTNSFYCFGCQVGGGVIEFIKRMENLDYIDAVRLLADRSGLQMPEFEYDSSAADRRLKLAIYGANREAAMFYYKTLYSDKGREGLDYFRNTRGLSDDIIKRFGLGFAPDERSALTDHLIKKGYRPSDLVLANLSFQDRYGGYSDRFRGRAMFPIIDVRRNVIAFGGRAMKKDEKAKYLNTSDTPVYKKTNNLYSINRAKDSKENYFILCEGYMDVIALSSAGFDNVVGGLGTALTEQQARLIKRYRDSVVLCYDSDEAGQKAAMKAIGIFDKLGVDIKVLKVPDGKDPDEYIRRHGQNGYIKFKALVESAKSEIEYYYDSIREKYNTQTVDGKRKALEESAHFLASLSNPVKRDLYSGKISDDMGVKRESLDAVINADLRAIDKREAAFQKRTVRNQALSAVSSANSPKMISSRSRRSEKAEEGLIACLIVHPETISDVVGKLKVNDFTAPLTSKLYGMIKERTANGMGVSLANLSGELTEEENMQTARMVARFNEQPGSGSAQSLCSEYTSVILEEAERLTTSELMQESDEDISAYFRESKMKKRKKRDQG